MKWPEVPTCHDAEPHYLDLPIEWRPADPMGEQSEDVIGGHNGTYGYPFRTCSYCGSMHPEDLAYWLQQPGVEINGSDWKYGWPHKFYIENIPNPKVGLQVVSSARSEFNGTEHIVTPGYGPAPAFTFAKWYNTHLRDQGYDREAILHLLELLNNGSGITFAWDETGLKYSAPYAGYQRSNI